MSVLVAGIPKNRCRTTVAEPMLETLAELPFIGDQVVCLSHNQAAQNGSGRELIQVARELASLPDPRGNWIESERGNGVEH